MRNDYTIKYSKTHCSELAQSYIGIEQAGYAVNAPFGGLVLYRGDIGVAVCLYPCVRQAPFKYRVIVVVDFFSLLVSAHLLHGQAQGFIALDAAYHPEAVVLHVLDPILGTVAVIVYPQGGYTVLSTISRNHAVTSP